MRRTIAYAKRTRSVRFLAQTKEVTRVERWTLELMAGLWLLEIIPL